MKYSILISVFCLFLLTHSVLSSPGYPAVLIPGDGGSQVQAKYSPRGLPWYCTSSSNSFNHLWFDLSKLLEPFIKKCTVHDFTMVFDPKTGKSQNTPGVETRIPGWGDTHSVEYFDKSKISPSKYYNKVVSSLVEKHNYIRNISIRGAPFDFRQLPNNDNGLLERVALLVEDTYRINGNKKVVLVAHSLGNWVALEMLQRLSQDWKDKYIRAYVALAPPLLGAVKTLRLIGSGDTLGIPLMPPNLIRSAQRSFLSSYLMMPNPAFWSKNEVIALTNTRNYTAHEIQDFLTDMNYNVGWQMHQLATSDIHPSTPPDVEVHCLHGVGRSTPAGLDWRGKNFPDDVPVQVNGDGDGTVNIRSLRSCLQWSGKQSQPVYHKEYNGLEHLDMLQNQEIVQYVAKLLTGQ